MNKPKLGKAGNMGHLLATSSSAQGAFCNFLMTNFLVGGSSLEEGEASTPKITESSSLISPFKTPNAISFSTIC